MAEFLLEILSEEIPARMQARAAADLKRLVTLRLEEDRLGFTDASAFATPRRLALVVDGLPDKQPDIVEERKGPRTDAPDKAIQGFLKSAGLDSVEQCEVREIKGKEFYFSVEDQKGRDIHDLLPALVGDVVWQFFWPKSMKWGKGSQLVWVRPITSVLSLFGGVSFEVHIKRGFGEGGFGVGPFGGDSGHELRGGQSTIGHRFLAPDAFEVADFADYEKKLRDAYVILDGEERKKVIAEQAAALTSKAGLTVKDDPALLDEVAGLVEWPVVLMGTIDGQFMDLPPEVLETSMRSHQKYFSCLDKDGKFANKFLVVSNMEAPEGSVRRANIIAGNERVLRARLADARFFYDTDRAESLSSRTPALKDIVFHAKLGTLDAKIDRVQALAVEIAQYVPGADKDRVRSAARLAKADLTAGMVGEFPELQGTMGRYYALHDGEHQEVADAIAEHYSPLGPADTCPTKPVSVAVALADKIDTLVGFRAIDEKPTGSKDPYALRRAAQGVIRLVLENGLRLPLLDLFKKSNHLYAESLSGITWNQSQAVRGLLDFFADRLKVHLREQGVRHDLVNAVFALGGEDDLVRLLARVDALTGFLETDDGANLLVAYRRAVNIVGIEEKKDKASYGDPVDPDQLTESAEKALYEELGRVEKDAAACIEKDDFTSAMEILAKLRLPVDLFFDQVTVNTEEANLRANRLRLLSQIRATLGTVADFSKIEG